MGSMIKIGSNSWTFSPDPKLLTRSAETHAFRFKNTCCYKTFLCVQMILFNQSFFF